MCWARYQRCQGCDGASRAKGAERDVGVEPDDVRVAVVQCVVLEAPHPRRPPERVGRVRQHAIHPPSRRERVMVGVVHDRRPRRDEGDDEHARRGQTHRQRQRRKHETPVADPDEDGYQYRVGVQSSPSRPHFVARRHDASPQLRHRRGPHALRHRSPVPPQLTVAGWDGHVRRTMRNGANTTPHVEPPGGTARNQGPEQRDATGIRRDTTSSRRGLGCRDHDLCVSWLRRW